ncbi:GrpB family protein [bacterium]|nr:GrpB family protein [bacterium]
MRKIEVHNYDPSWPKRFETEKELLIRTLGEVVTAIHHIGSTAVPGLAAKPVIDMLVGVDDLSTLDLLNPDMEAIGYEPRGEFGIPSRRYFQKGGDARSHQIHAFLAGDDNITRHVAFRDYS